MKDKGVSAPSLAAGFNEHCQGHCIAKMHLKNTIEIEIQIQIQKQMQIQIQS